MSEKRKPASPTAEAVPNIPAQTAPQVPKKQEIDPTRYGDWEKNGRCIDF